MFVRLWRTIRLAFLILVFIGLGGFLLLTTPWHRWFRSPPDYAAEVSTGHPFVAAIYRFHADTNLWPAYLDDLSPAYLPAPPPPSWYYTLSADGPALSTNTPDRRTHVGFDFDPIAPRWRVFGEVENRVLPTVEPAAVTQPAVVAPEQRLSNKLAELDRRILREPALLDHRQGKASLLRSLHRLDEARQTIHAAADALPQSFWPPLALAALDNPPSVHNFAAWNDTHPGFTHSYYLALLEREAKDDSAALATLHKALLFPLTIAPDDPNTLAFYLWDETRYALSQKDFALVLQLTDLWQKADAAHQVSDKSHLPLRAGAQLATKDFPAATATLAALDALKPPYPLWAQNLPALRTAIAKKDPAFLYDPGPTPPPYPIFILTQ